VPARRRHRPGQPGGDLESRQPLRCAGREEPDRVTVRDGRRGGARGRAGEHGHRPDLLARNPEDASARDQDPGPGCLSQDPSGELRHSAADMLRAIKNEQRRLARQRTGNRRADGRPRPVADAERGGHPRLDQRRIGDQVEGDERGPVAGGISWQPPHDLQRQPGLPAPPGPTSETSLLSASTRVSAAISGSRPTKEDTGAGGVPDPIDLTAPQPRDPVQITYRAARGPVG
jgi:hypothetical protein